MSFGSDELSIICHDGTRRPARGLQVGYLLVQRAEPGCAIDVAGTGYHRPARPWLVVHLPSGLCLDYVGLPAALAVADAFMLALGDVLAGADA